MSRTIQVLLSANLRRLRSVRRLSQKSLAQRSGISASYLSEIEGGTKFPTGPVLQSITDVLGCHPSELFLPLPDGNELSTSVHPSTTISEARERILREFDALTELWEGEAPLR